MRTSIQTLTFTLSTLALVLAGCDTGEKKPEGKGDLAKKDGGKKRSTKDEKNEGEPKAEADRRTQKDDGGKEDAPGADFDAKAEVLASIEAYNAGKFDEALRAFDENVELVFPGSPESKKGTAAIKSSWEEGRKAFPDTKVAAPHVFVGKNLVAAHMISNATHEGEFMGIAPTKKKVGSELLYVMEHDGKKFTKATIYTNPMALASQVGAAPKGMPEVPVPELPSGASEVIEGEPNQDNIKLIESFNAAFVDGTAGDKVADFLAENAKHHSMRSGKTTEGHAGAKKDIAEMKKAFADTGIRDVEMVGAGDWVFVRAVWTGKHVGKIGGMKATNKEFAVDFADLYRFEGGKIAEVWGFSNPMQMMVQLGLAPEGGKPEEKAADEKVAAKTEDKGDKEAKDEVATK
jgi:predicted ester cyclase